MAVLKQHISKYSLTAIALAVLAGCGSDSGEPTTNNVNPDTGNGGNSGAEYDGPAPQTDDIQLFKLHVWDNLAVPERCGDCHGTSGQQPSFVRNDDINEAYRVAEPLIDLGTPQLSTLVSKVGGGHNCWLDSATACADIIEGYITSWASSVGTLTNEIVLLPPEDKEVADSKNFTADPGAFSSTVYPLLAQYCSACHAEDAPLQQQPYLGSDDIQVSYEAARSRIRLDAPDNSRLVQRLALESHNCWSGSCASDAASMTQAIEDFVASLPVTEVDPNLAISKALQLGDGIIASSGGRVESDVIAKYEFKAGEGSIAYDTSGVEPAADLTINGNVEWMSSWGLRINDGKAQASTATSRKLFDLITSTGEYTIETWVIPDNVTQEEAHIVGYSGSTQVRNFTLGQTLYNYDFFHRSSTTDGNGMPALSTADADERLQASLQHAVITFDPVNGRRIYVNGEYTGDVDEVESGNLNEWDSSYALVVGNEVSSDRLWMGSLRFLAIHNRALSAEAVAANYEVGVGQKYFLLFNISELIGLSQAYLVFQVQQFDDYSYLFSEPFFANLGDEAIPTVPVEGIRIGINGREAIVGQVFAALDTEINAANYVEGKQDLSRQGAVIGLEQGAELDTFFLTFDRLGEHEYVRVEAEPPAPQPAADIDDQPLIGIKTFAEIDASLAAMTGVPRSTASVASTYQKVEQQLPVISQMDGFLAAQQMGITQLAVSYCSALVDDSSLRADFFPGFNFAATAGSAFDVGDRNQVIEPLLSAMVAGEVSGSALASQPNPDTIRTELNSLIDTMTACGGSCDTNRTATTVKATCAAALGSAIMLVH
ncbi:LamG domain-containing protein [Gilvimarinus sp. SDUM040013]|uniref:LamG domain-containing protein n=1 Tax=Gilvimarinus gilvus TaxID=3058038 RepID=A0ABU4RZE3_9GAMM|nr:LamG domain-containing protein [Gilvimarinus sp. SDUM040013]MDO3384684.1 LamG domain-containing protein [Gilvimarinus sp. SDUM040013]MDX6850270.1 LamG domain-containing protein [Gilvimarinus sp. SDUM040013]